jgi:hypothetical protein
LPLALLQLTRIAPRCIGQTGQAQCERASLHEVTSMQELKIQGIAFNTPSGTIMASGNAFFPDRRS